MFVINEGSTLIVGKDGEIVDTSTLRNGISLNTSIQSFGDSPILDSFGRLRVSEPMTLMDSKQIFNNQSLYWSDKTSVNGSSTYSRDNACTYLTTTTTSGDLSVRQTKEYFNYQSGKSLLIFLSTVIGEGKTNVRKRVGYFDVDNGIYFEQNGSTLSINIRSKTTGSVVNTSVLQSNWNIDTFNGSGESGITLDVSKSQIFVIDLEWLGVGRVRCGFLIDGKIYYVHEFLNANNTTGVYMATPNLPCRYEIENIGSVASSTELIQICSSVILEGGQVARGITRVGERISAKAITGVNTPVYSIRLKSLYNRSQLIPIGFNSLVLSNDTIICNLILGGTLTGASWVDVDSISYAQYDISATAITGGIPLTGGYAASSGNSVTLSSNNIDKTSILKVVSDIEGVSDILTLVARSVSGSSSVVGGITWQEVQ